MTEKNGTAAFQLVFVAFAVGSAEAEDTLQEVTRLQERMDTRAALCLPFGVVGGC